MIQRRIYRVTAATIDEINRNLALIADRLDQMEGFRGTPQFQSDIDMGGNRGTNAADAVSGADLTTKDQLIEISAGWPIGRMIFTLSSDNPSTTMNFGTWEAVGTGMLHIGTGAGGAGLVGSYGTNILNISEPRTLVYIWQRTA